MPTATRCNTHLQHAATCCNMLESPLITAVCRLKHTATYCNTLPHIAIRGGVCSSPPPCCTSPINPCIHALQHTAMHCNAVKRTETHGNVRERTATHCNALQRTATHCNALQRTATHCNAPHHTMLFLLSKSDRTAQKLSFYLFGCVL